MSGFEKEALLVKQLAKATNSDPLEIINALVGIAWDEEFAGLIKEALIKL